MEEATQHTEIVLAGLLACVAALVTIARIINVPYPIFLVIGGLGIGLIPGLPEVTLDPDLVLLIFLPPLLYSAAFFASLRDLRQNIRPIGMLAIGLVLATCVAVAVVAHTFIDGMSWPVAFLLGAIVSPTDPVAATAIAGRLGIPTRVVTIVEGESLINDATAIVAYRVALAAVVTGTFSEIEAGASFVYGAAGGVAIGLGVGWVVAQVRERLHDPPVEATISLLTAYLAYLPAEELGLSGVVAAVTVGLYMGSQTSRLTDAAGRMQTIPVWEVLVFLLNSVLFVLIGLQLPVIIDDLRGEDIATTQLIAYGLAVSGTVIAVRLTWTFVFAYLPHWIWKGLRERNPVQAPRNVAIIAWMGMRGAVSLAAALAIPATIESGAPFPQRALILFIVFCVILVTLVLQGLTLPALIRALRVEPDGTSQVEENKARKVAAMAALERIDELGAEGWTRDESVERMRGMYQYRVQRFAARFDDGDDGGYETNTDTYSRMMREVIDAQRRAIDRLRRERVINDQTMRSVERDLDLEESRLPSRKGNGTLGS